jgi:5'-nucleotidase
MSFTRRHFLMGSLAAPVGLSRTARAASPERTSVVLLHTNDTHSRLDPFPQGQGNLSNRGGVARRATVIRRVRKDNPNVLVLDAGDTFQGTPYYNRYHGLLDYELMSMAGYDATNVGNHDFDGGAEGLVKASSAARFDILTSYKVDGSVLQGVVKEHVVRKVGGITVGIFGIGVVLDGLVNPKHAPNIRYVDPVEHVRRKVDELRGGGADLVVALSHLGHQGYAGEPGDMHWPQRVSGVDYVVGGHTHTFLEKPEAVVGPGGWKTAVMQVGFAGLSLGHARLAFDGRNKVELAGNAIPVGPVA